MMIAKFMLLFPLIAIGSDENKSIKLTKTKYEGHGCTGKIERFYPEKTMPLGKTLGYKIYNCKDKNTLEIRYEDVVITAENGICVNGTGVYTESEVNKIVQDEFNKLLKNQPEIEDLPPEEKENIKNQIAEHIRQSYDFSERYTWPGDCPIEEKKNEGDKGKQDEGDKGKKSKNDASDKGKKNGSGKVEGETESDKPATEEGEKKKSDLSGGEIAGIVIGGVAFVAAIGLAIWFGFRKN